MRVMTTRTGQFPARAQSFPRRRDGVVGEGMAPCLRSNPWMTPTAELVNRLFQHELLVRGMGVMTDNAAFSGHNPVDIRHTIRRLLGHEPFLITMAGQAKLQ